MACIHNTPEFTHMGIYAPPVSRYLFIHRLVCANFIYCGVNEAVHVVSIHTDDDIDATCGLASQVSSLVGQVSMPQIKCFG